VSISYRANIERSWMQAARPVPTVRALAGTLDNPDPVSLRELLDDLSEPEIITREMDINTDDDTPLNGHVGFTLRSDGTYEFFGHMRATGFPSYHYGVEAWIEAGDATGTVIGGQRSGHVYGTDTPGDRQDNWRQSGTNPAIAARWLSIRENPTLNYQVHADISGVLGTAEGILTFAFEYIIANAVAGWVGALIVVGDELVQAGVDLGTPDVLAGLLVAGGVLMVLGPFGALPAAIAGIVTADLAKVRHRQLRDDERLWADQVFMGQLDYDRIWLTNLSRDGGRAFTWPSLGSTILVNIDDAIDDPSHTAQYHGNTEYNAPGQVLIHELTHAWQIQHRSFSGLVCNAAGTYDYGGRQPGESGAPPGGPRSGTWSSRPWDDFGDEQQAHLVDDWFGMYNSDVASPVATADPAFHYIRDNIRQGKAGSPWWQGP
jgi:hypothetical protein